MQKSHCRKTTNADNHQCRKGGRPTIADEKVVDRAGLLRKLNLDLLDRTFRLSVFDVQLVRAILASRGEIREPSRHDRELQLHSFHWKSSVLRQHLADDLSLGPKSQPRARVSLV